MKLGFDTPIVSWAAQFFRYLLSLSEKIDSHPPVIIFAHSQGAIISEHALKHLNIDERRRVLILLLVVGLSLKLIVVTQILIIMLAGMT
jgi:esterase/lipase superfamily enzyme